MRLARIAGIYVLFMVVCADRADVIEERGSVLFFYSFARLFARSFSRSCLYLRIL